MECEHTNTVTSCDGTQHVVFCTQCGTDVLFEACEDAGTWPTEVIEEI